MSVDVERLTRTHLAAIETDEGTEYHQVQSLLSQLHDAVMGGMESTGGGGTNQPKIPIAADALDLYMEIDHQISEAWAAAFKRVPGVSKPESLLAEWAAWAQPDTMVETPTWASTAADAVRFWEQRIEGFFDPPRTAEIDAACPESECGQRYAFRNSDGEEIRKSALVFTRSRRTGHTINAQCIVCGRVWQRSEMERFAALIGIDADKKRQEFTQEDS